MCQAAFWREGLSKVKEVGVLFCNSDLQKKMVYLIMPAITSQHALRLISFIYLYWSNCGISIIISWVCMQSHSCMLSTRQDTYQNMCIIGLCQSRQLGFAGKAQVPNKINNGSVLFKCPNKPWQRDSEWASMHFTRLYCSKTDMTVEVI